MQFQNRVLPSELGLIGAVVVLFLAAGGCGRAHLDAECGDGGRYFESDVARYCAYVVIRSGFRCPPALRHRFDFEGGAVCSDLPTAEAGDLPPNVCRYFGTAECDDPAAFDGGRTPPPDARSDAGVPLDCLSTGDCAPNFVCVDALCVPQARDGSFGDGGTFRSDGGRFSDGSVSFDARVRRDGDVRGPDGGLFDAPPPRECGTAIPEWSEPAGEWLPTVSHINTLNELIVDGDFLFVYATSSIGPWDLTAPGSPVVPLSVSELTPGTDTCFRVESSVRYGDGRVVETGPFQTLGGSDFPYYLVGLDPDDPQGRVTIRLRIRTADGPSAQWTRTVDVR